MVTVLPRGGSVSEPDNVNTDTHGLMLVADLASLEHPVIVDLRSSCSRYGSR
jgi:hypothetical protein